MKDASVIAEPSTRYEGARAAESLHFTSDVEGTLLTLPCRRGPPYLRPAVHTLCSLDCVLVGCVWVRLDAMNLLLPADERESDQLLDDAVSVKREQLHMEEAKMQSSEAADDEKEAVTQDEDEEELEESDVLVSLSRLPTAPGGPARSRILALDKLTELEANGDADEEEAEEGEAGEDEWESNWHSAAAVARLNKTQSASAASLSRAAATQRRKQAQNSQPHTDDTVKQRRDQHDSHPADRQQRKTDQPKPASHSRPSRSVSSKQRVNSSTSERDDAVVRSGKRRKKGE